MRKVISTSEAPGAVGPYSQAIFTPPRGLLYTAGQVALDPVSGKLIGTTAAEQAEQVMKNLAAVLKAGGCSFDDVIKSTIFLLDMTDFAAVNEVYARVFSGSYPARSTVAVHQLPKEARVEIEMIAARQTGLRDWL